ncbi:Transcription factor GRAS [Dillenia turbinata]|uniref:Transcription factor GRAS n=1 Tax=Dillenia turbinata TaxID=194707 RepID=A0AAN8VM91_9MAGN
MENVPHFYPSDYAEFQDECSSSKGFKTWEVWRESAGINGLWPEFGYFQDYAALEEVMLTKYEQQLSGSYIPADVSFNIIYPQNQLSQEKTAKLDESQGLAELRKEKPEEIPLSSVEILKTLQSRFRRLNGKRFNTSYKSKDSKSSMVGGWKFSTVMIVKVAGSSVLNVSQNVDDLSMNFHPYSSSLFSPSEEETKYVELVRLLLASAEKISCQQFNCAQKLLNLCNYMSSDTGNPVQRIVFYFSEALQERINQETGTVMSKSSAYGKDDSFDVKQAMLTSNHSSLSLYQQIPIFQVAEFTAVQAILENLALAKKVHLIDFGIRSGVQWVLLMQAFLARGDSSLELLKITAVGTTAKENFEDIGKHLSSFAATLNFPFSFDIVMVQDMKFLKESLFKVEDDEVVVVYAPIYLCTLISKPDRLESLMRVIKKLNPLIMVIIEVEANHNSSIFLNRFTEALFFYGAFFDCLETCMTRNDQARMMTEALHLSEGIRNIVATNGAERAIWHVKNDIWRAFFARFGLTEMDLSTSALYQASLLVEKFTCGRYCTLDMDEKALLIGWKGTPIHSLSIWRLS